MLAWIFYTILNFIALVLLLSIMYSGVLLVKVAYLVYAESIEREYIFELRDKLYNSNHRNYWKNLWTFVKEIFLDLVSKNTSYYFKGMVCFGLILSLPLTIVLGVSYYFYLIVYDYMLE